MDAEVRIITEKGGHRVLLTLDGHDIETPPIEHVLYYLGLAALAQAGLIELPIVLALGVGHVILDITRRPGLTALGEALEEA